MNRKEEVFVAMSGGVDSAVAAALLLERGFRLEGIFMRTWRDPKWEAMQDHPEQSEETAKATAKALGIPLTVLDLRDSFYSRVVDTFLREYLAGKTPNPCLFCNPQVKWGLLQTYALEKGASYFATGHYARIVRGGDSPVELLRGVDQVKDQSYVLSMLTQAQLGRSLLPLGEMSKASVRKKARCLDLPAANRQDSQDLCFLGEVDYRDFLERFAQDPPEPGRIVNLSGQDLGEHRGLPYYTIGQRRGLGIAAPEPYYVIEKDAERNLLVVAHKAETGRRALTASGANWIAGRPPDPERVYDAMIRYRAKPVAAHLDIISFSEFRLEFKNPLQGITPGQVVVLYAGQVCLGGGVIR
jgi:tRNA-specific 2-thiouridylase